MRLKSWGKVNLTLHVQGVRADGYHLLHSYVVSVDVGDELDVCIDPSGLLSLEVQGDVPAPPGRDNLAWKAAAALQALRPRVPLGARLRIHKQIPAAAGMGGASANAAGVLVALNHLWQLGLTSRQLAEVGLSLGADVPFCLQGGLALMEGIGERLTPLTIPGSLALVRVVPRAALSTRQVFQRYATMMGQGARAPGGVAGRASVTRQTERGSNPKRPKEPGPPAEFLQAWREGPRALAAWLHNDLEPAAVQLAPEISRAKAALLEAGAKGAVMSGSGPTVVGLAEDEADAERISRFMARRGFDAHPMGLRPAGIEELPVRPSMQAASGRHQAGARRES